MGWGSEDRCGGSDLSCKKWEPLVGDRMGFRTSVGSMLLREPGQMHRVQYGGSTACRQEVYNLGSVEYRDVAGL